MKVLVTGGAGFIGSHIVDQLVEQQYEVVIVDNLTSGSIDNVVSGLRLYEININDPELESVFLSEKPDYVIHLAAQTSVTQSMNDPYSVFDSNTAGTVKLLLLCKKYDVKRFVFASSAAVYGEPQYLPIDEKHPVSPLSFYSVSKYSAESFLSLFCEVNNISYTILRFSNVFGPRQNSDNEAGVIPVFIQSILENKQFKIFGGNQTRDFVYVKDVGLACLLALENNLNTIYNISTNHEISINELVYELLSIIGKNPFPQYEEARVGEIERSILDNRKALVELGWQPSLSFAEGLMETIQYYQKGDYIINKK